MKDDRQVDFEALPWQIGAPGIRFKAAERGGQRIRLVEMEPGIEHDWCTTGHVGYVLEGELEIEMGEGVLRLTRGEAFLIAAGEAERHRPMVRDTRARLLLVEELDASAKVPPDPRGR